MSDRIFCISDFSKETLRKFSEEQHIDNIPNLKTIHLGDSVIQEEKNNAEPKKQREHGENYVLYVSTIEVRKNHIVLLKAWQKLIEQKMNNLPHLVFVGMWGWGVEDVKKSYEEDKELQKVLHIYNDVNDQELATLYKSAKFTVFPSFIEGWGLAAVESLLYGKMCLVSNCDALKEATQGLMPTLEADDVEAWAGMIKKLSSDPKLLKHYGVVIEKYFQARSWQNFSAELLDYMLKKV